MADELDLEQLDEQLENQNKVEKRIKDLSDKVKLTSTERDELDRLNKEKDDKIATLEKENGFLGAFGDVLGKYPNAKDFKDAIKEKVLKGYSIEDAAIATLASEGKLTPPTPAPVEAPVGGPAAPTPPAPSDKTIAEMTQQERRAALMEAEARGDIGVT